jgi:hypothetical protein
MKKKLHLFAFVLALCSFYSCKKDEVNMLNNTLKPEQAAPQQTASILNGLKETGRITPGDCSPTEVALIAGQNMNAGTVTVTNDADFIYVTYHTANGWLLTQTHLFVGSCALIPVNGQGNPVPGQFPYASSHINITSFTYQIPVSQIPLGGCGCIAAHAVVVKLDGNGNIINTQTGWGQGVRINPNGGNWGMKFEYCSCTP